MRKIGLMLPNWIGDVVMATPAIRAVRQQYPHAHLLGIMRPYVAGTLSGTNWLDERLEYDPMGKAAMGRRNLVSELRHRDLDCMLLFPNSFSSAMTAWLGGARRRVGYSRNGRAWMLSDRLSPPREGMKILPNSAVDYYLELATHIGCKQTSRRMELATTKGDEASVERAWFNLGLYDAENVVAINTGGAYGTAKRWPDHHTVELARGICGAVRCEGAHRLRPFRESRRRKSRPGSRFAACGKSGRRTALDRVEQSRAGKVRLVDYD